MSTIISLIKAIKHDSEWLQRAHEFQEWLWRPEGFASDLLIITDRESSGAQVVEALDRLVHRFPRGEVFHRERWRSIEGAFRAYQEECGYGEFKTVWQKLVRTALLVAIRNIPEDYTIEEIYQYLRNKVRNDIENEIRNQTLATRTPHVAPVDPDEIGVEEIGALSEQEKVERDTDKEAAMKTLTFGEQHVLRLWLEGFDDASIGKSFDPVLTVEAVRQRRSRAFRKLEKLASL